MSGGAGQTLGRLRDILLVLARPVLGESRVVPGPDKTAQALMESVDLAESLNQCLDKGYWLSHNFNHLFGFLTLR